MYQASAKHFFFLTHYLILLFLKGKIIPVVQMSKVRLWDTKLTSKVTQTHKTAFPTSIFLMPKTMLAALLNIMRYCYH